MSIEKIKSKKHHVSRLLPALLYSWGGLKAAYKHETAFRQEMVLAMFFFPLAVYISESFIEFAILTSSIVAILVAELMNSAIEAVVDRVGLDRHELSGRAKDLGSAAVLLAIFYFVLIWTYKFYSLF